MFDSLSDSRPANDPYVTYTDVNGVSHSELESHVNIYYDQGVIHDMTQAVETRIMNQVN